MLDGPINGERFLIYIEQVLAPTPLKGGVVIIDNLAQGAVRHALRRAGARLLFLPKYLLALDFDGSRGLDLVNELTEPGRAMAREALADDLPGGDVESEERARGVAGVVVAAPRCLAASAAPLWHWVRSDLSSRPRATV